VEGSSGGRRVLVVDDVDEMRILIHRALSTSGYQVDVAATLAQARAMDPAGYDAVLVDAGLGPDRGMDLIEALRSEDPAAAGKCLVMTGGAADTIPAGVARLTKPFKLAELLTAVHALHQVPAARAAGSGAGVSSGSGTRAPVTEPPAASRPGAAAPQAWQLLGIVRRLRERERHELVDFLHDGPIQGLTAVALDLQMARSEIPVPAPRLAAAMQQLDAAAGSLRWLIDGHWTSLMAQTTLADALRQRTAWLLAAPATVHSDALAAVPTATEIPVIADVAELMLLGILPASLPMRADVAVRTEADEIRIELALTAASRDERPASDPAAVQAALGELAFALGAAAQVDIRDQPWRARLVLPRQSGTKAA
jgi:CheY-like chemotaxis protein